MLAHSLRHTAPSARCIGAALVLSLAGGLAVAPPAQASSSSGSTLQVEADTSFSTFNPFLAYFIGDRNVIGNIYPALTMINQQGVAGPYLATKWTSSANKLAWSFTIRKGLKWSDGVPITAQDAAWTFNLIMHDSTAATAYGALVANFASVTAPNATTLVITTKQPEANMLYVSDPITGIPIVPEHIWSKEVAHLASFKNVDFPVVGYGPWVATGYVTNQYATLTANPNFFMGAPKFHTLIIQHFTNSDAAVAALRSGQISEIDNLTAIQFEALKSDKNIQLVPSVSNGWTAIELNPGAKTKSGKPFGNGNPALQDPRVREAIEMAINKQKLVSNVWDGLAVTGSGYLPPAYPQYVWTPPASSALTYDPAKANALLNQAGYKMGPGGIRIDPKTHKPLVLRLGIHSEGIDAEMAPYLQEWLKAIGISVDVQPMSFNKLNAVLPKGDWDMLSDAWGTGPDPTYLLSIQTCRDLPDNPTTPSNTDAFFCNQSYDDLFNQQATKFTPSQRVALIDQMQQILYQNAVDVILYYPDKLSAVRTIDAKNFFYGPPNAQGFYPQQNLFINWLSATPVAADVSSSSSPALWIIIVVVVAPVLAGAMVVIRRRSTTPRSGSSCVLSSTAAPRSAQGFVVLESPPQGWDSGGRDFLSYISRKLAAAVLSFAVLLVVGFIIFSLMPSEPVAALTRGHVTSAKQMTFLIKQLGLNQPVWERFGHFVGNTLQGRLGYSWQFQTPVSTLIAQRLWPTLLLMGSSTILSIVLGMWLGIHSGWRPGSLLDWTSTGTAITLWSVPAFWLGIILLVIFSAGIGPIPSLFPAGGMSTPGTVGGFTPVHIVDVTRHLVLPCLTLVLVNFAQYQMIMRSSMIDEQGNAYLLTARAKGLRDAYVRRRHALPNALLPSVTLIFLQIGTMVSGAITVETVYSWPGLGYLTYQALQIPDLPLLEGTFLVFSASVIVFNLLADVLYRYLDPRVRRT